LGQPVRRELCLLALCHKNTAALHNLCSRNHMIKTVDKYKRELVGTQEQITNSSDYWIKSIIMIICQPISFYDTTSVSKIHHNAAFQTWFSKWFLWIIRFRGFCLTQLCFNSCLLFYSNHPLHVSVIQPSSSENICMLFSDVYISAWR
jgi:hypothetical protein